MPPKPPVSQIIDPTGLEQFKTWTEARRKVFRFRYAAGRKYAYDPVLWAEECIRWNDAGSLTDYQRDILDDLVVHSRAGVVSPHGVGKSTSASLAVLWFSTSREMLCTDWKAITTAGAWRQLERYLWPEIHKWASLLDWSKLWREPFTQKELLDLSIKLEYGQAFAVASTDPHLLEGAHGDSILYVFDEAKRLDVATPIPTPTGWMTMGDLTCGDMVLDEMGRPCRVTMASPVLFDRPCYRVTFEDGASLVADEGHLWAALAYERRQTWGQTHRNDPCYKRTYEPVTDWRAFWDQASIVTTEQLVPLPDGSAIPTCCPLDLPTADLPIDPYVLGAWLGDGSSGHGAITTMDPEVLSRIEAAGYPITRRSHSGRPAETYGIIGLRTQLARLGLLDNKHIPSQYLRAGVAQRLELLRGLMDTDGCTMANGLDSRVAISQVREVLAEQIAELARTFGWKVRVAKRTAKLDGIEQGPAYLLRWSADVCPFHLPRKAERWRPCFAQGSSSTIRTIRSIERVASVPTRCIAVDSPRRLYLAGEGFVPTHNSIPAKNWQAAEGAFAGASGEKGRLPEAFALALSTPGEPEGVFYDICNRRRGYEEWHPRRVSLDDAIRAGRISPVWAEARKRQWGEQSQIYANRVLGEFASSDENVVIPLGWVEMAIERWYERQKEDHGPVTEIGVDVARQGDDETVFCLKHDDYISELQHHRYADTTVTAGFINSLMSIHQEARAVIDSIGIGAGVYDMVREMCGNRVTAFQGSERSRWRDRSEELKFKNQRAASLWHLRELLDPAYSPTLCIPPDELLLGELPAAKWTMDRYGNIVIEPKEDIKERIGRSPDSADALAMACSDPKRRGHVTFAGRVDPTSPRRLRSGPDSEVHPELIGVVGTGT